MKRRYTSRPAPLASAVAAVVGLFMLLFVIMLLSRRDDGFRQVWHGPMGLFLVVWVLALVGIVIYHIFNAVSPSGVPTQIIESDDDTAPISNTTAGRLQELEDLRSRKLVSEEEYQAKRQEILKGL